MTTEHKAVVSIKEYRKMLDDYLSLEELIKKRLEYLQSFCRNIIQIELEKLKKKK